MTSLDWMPIQGRHLIQASAGTGKTHTIISLVLRLLLGQDDKGEPIIPLGLNQILVVTFTRAATAELRERIGRRLMEAKTVFAATANEGAATANEEVKDKFLRTLWTQSKDKMRDLKLLKSAFQQTDEAAIFTIHSFCQRILTESAFESGFFPKREFVMDQSEQLQSAVQDFWRREVYPLSTEFNCLVREFYANPDALVRTLGNHVHKPGLLVQGQTGKSLEGLGEELKATLLEVKERWQKDKVQQVIEDSSASKAKTKPGGAIWLDQINLWVQSEEVLTLPSNDGDTELSQMLKRYSRASLTNPDNLKKAGEPPAAEGFFDAIDKALDCLNLFQVTFLANALRSLHTSVNPDSKADQKIHPDAVLRLTADILRRPVGVRLAADVRERYPVAFIDEFQDTDPEQWKIFSLLYPHQAHEDTPNPRPSALTLIGDPKQAIFSFRGADLNTYLEARKSVPPDRILDADVNWRASVPMLAAINALYQGHPSPFAHTEITFHKTETKPEAQKNEWCYQGKAQQALTFWYPNPEAISDTWSKSSTQETIAKITADKIDALLKGAAEIGGKPLNPADITCLVNNRWEGELLQQTLRKQGLSSSWHSRNPVFATEIAKDLRCVLAAVLADGDHRSVRTALAAALFDLSVPELYRETTEDESRWLQHLNRFKNYRRLWLERGLIIMLQRLLDDYGLVAGYLSKDARSARMLTDLRQLVELLQSQALVLGDIHSLYRWLCDQLEVTEESEAHQIRLESDAELVQITTVYKAKGLEYGIVILPFGIQMSTAAKEIFVVHDENTGGKRLVLESQADEATKLKAGEDDLSEAMRLLYVALTRAKYACFVGIPSYRIRSKNPHKTPLGQLLFQGQFEEKDLKENAKQIEGRLQVLSKLCPHICHEPYPQDLQELSNSNEVKDSDASANESDSKTPRENFAVRSEFRGTIDGRWGVTSYSSLIATGNFWADQRAGWKNETQETGETFSGADGGVAAVFPKGAVPGLCLHDILEQWSDKEAQAQVERNLQTRGIQVTWPQGIPGLMDWLQKVRGTPLGMGTDLASLSQSVPEMQFHLPIEATDTRQLSCILKNYGYVDAPLAQDMLQGMLQGFIDLIFEHEGKFWLADYKSNWLGERPDQYSQALMGKSMQTHRYDLQLLLYSTALLRLLKLHQPDVDPKTRFGGCCYLFLRGMDGSGKYGVYRHQPCADVLQEIDDWFAGKPGGQP